MIDKTTIQKVHDSADILSIVSNAGLTLIREGARYKTCCPFHSERTPSFFVNPERGTYHCFGCGKHGDAIDFLMSLESLSYPEAITKIARANGIEILNADPVQSEKEKLLALEREAMKIAIQATQDFFVEQFNLKTPEAEKARRYAYARWGKEYCQEIGIGYAPESFDAYPQYIRQNCIDEEALKKTGTLRTSKTGKTYCLFRHRITIPITDRYGKTIAFSARYIGPENDVPKYINSPESPIYSKGKTVFGLSSAIRQASRLGRFIIVEGGPDVLRLQSPAVGRTETVAALGTAWTEEQFRILKRYATSLVFIPDNDPLKPEEQAKGETFGPGIRAVIKNAVKAIQLGFSASVRQIPEQTEQEQQSDPGQEQQTDPGQDPQNPGPRQNKIQTKQDPDSWITDADKFAALQDQPFPVWYGTKLLQTAETQDEKTAVINKICSEVLINIQDQTALANYLELLSRQFGRLKLWKDALLRAKGEHAREQRRRQRDEMKEDQALMEDLGFFVRNNAYYSYNKDGDEYRWTNFAIEPLYHIIDGDNAIRLFKLRNERGTTVEIELRQEELISLSRFCQRIESLGYFNFKGDAIKLSNLKEYLYSITDSAHLITKLGWDAKNEIYAFGDAIFFENAIHTANDLGIVKTPEKSYYLPATARMNADQRDAYQLERSFSAKQHGDITLPDFLTRYARVFGPNANIGFSFLLATLFHDIVRRVNGSFPILNIFGRKQTGKTYFGTVLMSFFIRRNQPASLAQTTLSAMNAMLSAGENNLVHLDEYKNEINFRKIETLKAIWGGAGDLKMNMDGDKKARQTLYRSGVILTGQDAPTRDDALLSRMIHLTYSRTVFSEQEIRAFSELRNICALGLSHLTVQLLRLRPIFDADYEKHYRACRAQLQTALAEDEIENRVLDNWLAILAAFATAQTSIDAPFTYRELFDLCVQGIRHQNSYLTKNSDVALFWTLLDAAHMQGRVVNKAHFHLKRLPTIQPSYGPKIEFGRDKTLLFLNYNSVVNTLAQRNNGLSVVGRLDPSSLESYLKTHPAYLGTKQHRFRLLLPTGLPDYSYETVNGINVKRIKEVRPMAFIFDYEMLKQAYDISLEVIEREDIDLPEDQQ